MKMIKQFLAQSLLFSLLVTASPSAFATMVASGAPDFTVENVSDVFTTTGYTLSVDVLNQGDTDATLNTSTEVLVGLYVNAILSDSSSIAITEPNPFVVGETETVELSLAMVDSTSALQICVDYDDQWDELDENNNCTNVGGLTTPELPTSDGGDGQDGDDTDDIDLGGDGISGAEGGEIGTGDLPVDGEDFNSPTEDEEESDGTIDSGTGEGSLPDFVADNMNLTGNALSLEVSNIGTPYMDMLAIPLSIYVDGALDHVEYISGTSFVTTAVSTLNYTLNTVPTSTVSVYIDETDFVSEVDDVFNNQDVYLITETETSALPDFVTSNLNLVGNALSLDVSNIGAPYLAMTPIILNIYVDGTLDHVEFINGTSFMTTAVSTLNYTLNTVPTSTVSVYIDETDFVSEVDDVINNQDVYLITENNTETETSALPDFVVSNLNLVGNALSLDVNNVGATYDVINPVFLTIYVDGVLDQMAFVAASQVRDSAVSTLNYTLNTVPTSTVSVYIDETDFVSEVDDVINNQASYSLEEGELVDEDDSGSTGTNGTGTGSDGTGTGSDEEDLVDEGGSTTTPTDSTEDTSNDSDDISDESSNGNGSGTPAPGNGSNGGGSRGNGGGSSSVIRPFDLGGGDDGDVELSSDEDAACETTFEDISDSHAYAEICALYHMGVIHGYAFNLITFGPENALRYYEAAKMLARTLGLATEDAQNYSGEDYVRLMQEAGLMGEVVDANAYMTAAEFKNIFSNYGVDSSDYALQGDSVKREDAANMIYDLLVNG
ncbi:S-layer homology domain-containing protein [Candidatus Peregrinibacteria bacterium]|nr:MAG: S-layer homology domain-containing protein [Candidatus Peregrinibacteria bacterium]